MTDQFHEGHYSRQAEEAVLGALMQDPRAVDEVTGLLHPEDFYVHKHREVFRAIQALSGEGIGCDPVTLSDRFPMLDLADLGNLVRRTFATSNVIAYARTVRDRAVERNLDQAGADIQALARGQAKTAEKLDQAQSLVMHVSDESARGGRGPRGIREILSGFVEALDCRFQAGGVVTGLETGLPDLDEMTAGLQPQDLIILAARPSMGKTTLAMNIAEHQAVWRGTPVAVFSMEMSAEQLVERCAASVGRINAQHMRTGQMEDEDWPRVTTAVSRLAEAPLVIDDSPALSVHELRSRARRLKRTKDIGLIVVDYLQLMRGSGENRNLQVSDISAGLKSLAKELRVPVIALSQLNREVEKRSNKRPQMADLRDSGSIEQDADVIMFLYRDEVYNAESPYKGSAELLIGKQRNGPVGMVKLTFLGHQLRFESFAGEWPQEAEKERKTGPRGFRYADRAVND